MFKMLPTLLKLMKQVMTKGWSSISFTADGKCDACGICVKLCPVDNIALAGKKPQWSAHCAGCFACIQWCPKDAIHLGTSNLSIAHYHHPEVSLADIFAQKMNR
jgi:MinD superfamily P-loop ATPase